MADTADLPGDIAQALPVAPVAFCVDGRRPGLVIVDVVRGFAEVGCGALAPAAPNARVTRMIGETVRLARVFSAAGQPILVILDTHQAGIPEPPYPTHCEQGSGEEELIDALIWLEGDPAATLMRKDCINAFVGAIDRRTGANTLVRWIEDHRLDSLIVTGMCTDICVMDLVLTLLSVRNHGLAPTLTEVVVFEPGCATYDLPMEAALALGLGPTAAHPQALSHYIGLRMMAERGAIIADRLDKRPAEARR